MREATLTGARERTVIYSRQPYNHRRTAMRTRHGILALAVGMLLLPAVVHAQKVTPQGSNAKRDPATCHIEGVWQLESMNWGGQDQPQAGRTEHKMVSNGHFMWIGEEKRRDTIALHTQIDSMRAQLVTGGYGT